MSSALVWGVVFAVAGAAAAGEPLARIGLYPAAVLAGCGVYNPTAWEGPAAVEVPVGRLVSPGLIRWDRVRLTLGERDVPFAIREGG